jgi:hypothetical protein
MGTETIRTQYRVVSTGARTGPQFTHPTTQLVAEAHAKTQGETYEGTVRIQKRTVTETPWKDITEEVPADAH